MGNLARYLDRTPSLHVCGVKLLRIEPHEYRAWFKDGWKGPERATLRDAVDDMESELHRRADTLPRQPSR